MTVSDVDVVAPGDEHVDELDELSEVLPAMFAITSYVGWRSGLMQELLSG